MTFNLKMPWIPDIVLICIITLSELVDGLVCDITFGSDLCLVFIPEIKKNETARLRSLMPKKRNSLCHKNEIPWPRSLNLFFFTTFKITGTL